MSCLLEERDLCLLLVGDVAALDEDAGRLAGFADDRLEDEVHETLFRRQAGLARQHYAHPLSKIGAAAFADLVEQARKTLFHHFRQGFANGPSEQLATAHQAHVSAVCHFEDMLRSGHHSHEAWRLLEHQPQTLPLALKSPLGAYLGSVLNDNRHHAKAYRSRHRRGVVEIHKSRGRLAGAVEDHFLIGIASVPPAKQTFMTLSLKSATSGQPSRTLEPRRPG